jgi:hypothetical protein
MEFSPDDPGWAAFWANRYRDYEIYTLIFLVILAAVFTTLTILARRSKNPKRQKRLRLARKIVTWVSLIGWGLFVGVELLLIPLPF